MKCQKGNSSLIFCLFLTLLFLSGTLFLKRKVKFIQFQKEKLEFSLCIKKNNGEVRKFNNNLRVTNLLLKTLTIGEYTSLFIPPFLGVSLKYGIKKAIKALKLAQVTFYLSFLKHLNDLRKKGCIPSPNLAKTPYKLKLNGYERDIYNQALLRGNQWTFYITKGVFYSKTTFSAQTRKSKTKIKKVLPF